MRLGVTSAEVPASVLFPRLGQAATPFRGVLFYYFSIIIIPCSQESGGEASLLVFYFSLIALSNTLPDKLCKINGTKSRKAVHRSFSYFN